MRNLAAIAAIARRAGREAKAVEQIVVAALKALPLEQTV